MPTKTWAVGEEVLAADFNAMVQRQVVATFPNAAARTAAITAPSAGMLTYLTDRSAYQYWNGTEWAGLVGVLGYVQVTAPVTGFTSAMSDIGGLSVGPLTIPGGRRIEIATQVQFNKAAPDVQQWVQLMLTDSANTPIQSRFHDCLAPGYVAMGCAITISPAAGSYTWKARCNTGAGFVNVSATAQNPSWLRVTDLGVI